MFILLQVGWLGSILILIIAFLLGWILSKLMSSNSTESQPMAAAAPVMNSKTEESLKSEIDALATELNGSKDANGLLRAQIADLESKGHSGDMNAEQEEELRKDVEVLVSELKGAKQANALLRARLEDIETSSQSGDMNAEEEEELRKEVGIIISELKAAKGANDLLRARLSDIENDPSLAISPLTAGAVEPEDLTKIEGIGPKIAELCNGIGVHNFKQLSMTSVSQLQDMLDDAGPRYKIHSPNTWPAQASLATQGLWDQLKAWQDILDGGKI